MSGSCLASGPAIGLSILDTIREAQNQHGLRHHDYESYRQYCSHKLARLARRLRSSLKLRKPHASTFQRLVLPVLPGESLDASHLQYLVFELERDWALTHLLKQRGSEHNSRISAHIRKRAKRLLARSQALLALVQPATSPLSSGLADQLLIEALAYAHHMAGYASMLLRDWALSFKSLDTSLQYYALCPTHSVDEVKSTLKYVQHQSAVKDAAVLRSAEEVSVLEASLAHFSLKLRRSDLCIEWGGRLIRVADPLLAQKIAEGTLSTNDSGLLASTAHMPELHSYLLFERQAKKIHALLVASERAGSYEKYLTGGLSCHQRRQFQWIRMGNVKKAVKILEVMKSNPVLGDNLSIVKALENRMSLFSIEHALLRSLRLKKQEALPLLKAIKAKLAAAEGESEPLSAALQVLKQSEIEAAKWAILAQVATRLDAMLSGQAPNTLTRAPKRTQRTARSKTKPSAPGAVFYDAQAHDASLVSQDEDEDEVAEHQDSPAVHRSSPAPSSVPSSTSSIAGLLRRWWSGAQ